MFTLESFVANNRTTMDKDGNPTLGVEYIRSDDLVANRHYDPGLLRPYVDERGRVWVDVTVGMENRKDAAGNIITNALGQPEQFRITEPQLVRDRVKHGLPCLDVNNASALTKDQWIMVDKVVRGALRPPMRLWSDMRASVSYAVDGMATPILENQISTDPGEAQMDMEGISEGRNFTPQTEFQGTPLPLIHSDFWISDRFLQISMQAGRPGGPAAADRARIVLATRRVGECIEKTAIGLGTAFQYGDSTRYTNTAKVYGLINHPDRITYTSLTASATIATNIATTGGVTFVNMVLAMIATAAANNVYGPFALYTSTAYDDLLDNDYKPTYNSTTIRQRVLEIDRISSIKRLNYLTGDVLILVQLDPDFIQAVNGLEVQTVQWDEKGGMIHKFKVMGIQVPRLMSVYKTNTSGPTATRILPVIHGTTS